MTDLEIHLAKEVERLFEAAIIRDEEIERLTHLHNLDHSLADQWQAKNEKLEAEIERLLIRDELFAQLREQIKHYFGKDGGLAALQDGVERLRDGSEYWGMNQELTEQIATLREALEASCVCGAVEARKAVMIPTGTWEFCGVCKALAATKGD